MSSPFRRVPADAVAEMFAVDGLSEAPFVPAGKAFPRRMEGRKKIRSGLADYYEQEGAGGMGRGGG